MNILFVLIPISMVLLLIIIWTFAWAVRKGQFEDLDAAAIDILSDEAPPPGEQVDDKAEAQESDTAHAQAPPAGGAAAPRRDDHAD